MQFPRASGILLHISSLPSPFGIGDLGPSANSFVDYLSRAGQRIWQILPLSPTTQGNSPYSSYSAFAGNPILISPQELVANNWLDEKTLEAASINLKSTGKVDFDAARTLKNKFIRRAFETAKSELDANEEFVEFCSQNEWWLDDFARFESYSKHFSESNWTRWPEQIAKREIESITRLDHELHDRILYSKFVQFIFDQQWTRLKTYANQSGVRIYGDMPIFVAHESADVWSNQDQFMLDDSGSPTHVAGVPPDYFSTTGQLWGNPLYRWDVMEKDNYRWWTKRFKRALQQFDLLRVDHFRGFEAYWEIPANSETAKTGKWKPGPLDKPFEAARMELGELPIVAEDLGLITQPVHELRERLGFPCMRVLQFGFDSEDDNFHRPDNYPTHSVAHTGTHDNETVMGWYSNREPNLNGKVDVLSRYLSDEEPIHWQFVQMILDSNSDTAIIPMQDILGLNNDARMNVPSVANGNWEWQLNPGDLTDETADKLCQLVRNSNRLN